MINWKLNNHKIGPIGLDITDDSVKMIQLANYPDNINIVAADKMRMDHDIASNPRQRKEFIISDIQQILLENEFYN